MAPTGCESPSPGPLISLAAHAVPGQEESGGPGCPDHILLSEWKVNEPKRHCLLGAVPIITCVYKLYVLCEYCYKNSLLYKRYWPF